jgi:hypothetical protein
MGRILGHGERRDGAQAGKILPGKGQSLAWRDFANSQPDPDLFVTASQRAPASDEVVGAAKRGEHPAEQARAALQY